MARDNKITVGKTSPSAGWKIQRIGFGQSKLLFGHLPVLLASATFHIGPQQTAAPGFPDAEQFLCAGMDFTRGFQ